MAPSSRFALTAAAAAALITSVSASPVDNPNMPTLSHYAAYTVGFDGPVVPQAASSTPAAESTPSIIVSSAATSATSSIDAASSSSSMPLATSVAPVATTTSAPYENPFTVYLSMTDSRGVVTGMPTVVTSQPPVETECGGCETFTSLFASGTTMVTSASTHSASRSASASASSASESSSASATPTFSQTNGAGAASKITGTGMVLALLGCVFTLL